MEASSDRSSAGLASLEDYVEGAFELASCASDFHFRWAPASMRWTLTGHSANLQRYILPAFGSDIQRVSGPASSDDWHIHWIDAETSARPIMLPQIPIAADTKAEGARFVWIGTDVRAEYQAHNQILTIADTSKRRALVQVPSLSDLPYEERAAPIRGLLHGLMSGAGLSLMHGAVIGREGAGVLLVGRGGSGKSSAAVAGLMAGMHYVGDDYVLIDKGLEPRAYGLYATAKVLREDLVHGTPTGSTILNPLGPSTEKVVFQLRSNPDGFRSGLPLKAVLVPQIGDSPMHLAPCTPARALAGLAPSTLFQMLGEREALFAHCARLVRQLPSFILHTGPRTLRYPDDIARAIDRLLDEID